MGEYTWFGLFNPTNGDCETGDPSGCNDELFWADGTKYRYEAVPSLNDIELDANPGSGAEYTFGLSLDIEQDDPVQVLAQHGTAENPLQYFCEFTC